MVAVTGATGFIGFHLCNSLLRSGSSLRVLVRDPDAARELEAAGASLVVGDLAAPQALSQLLENAGTVVHCAGAVRGASQAEFDRTNLQGTSRLLTALQQRQPSPRLIMLSTLAARQPQLSWYASSKQRAERLVQEQADQLEWTILRPPPVYGPGDRELTPIFRWLAHGLLPIPCAPANRFSLLHVADLVRALVLLVDAEALPRQILSLADDRAEGYDWHELATVAAQVESRRVRLLRLPAQLLDLLAWTNLKLARQLHYAPMLTPAKLRELRYPDWVVDNREIQAKIEWRPSISLARGLKNLRTARG